jgi:hypothetical protein
VPQYHGVGAMVSEMSRLRAPRSTRARTMAPIATQFCPEIALVAWIAFPEPWTYARGDSRHE